MTDKLVKYDEAIKKYDPIFGIEVHVELATRTKMFCSAPNPAFDNAVGDDAPTPNTLTTPVSLGLPGALPVLNKTALEYAIRIGLALNCKIASRSTFARKNYFYPDLTKNFQTSQYDDPIAFDGYIDVELDDGEVFRVEIERAHMEEDAGKNTHIGGADGRIHGADHSLIDYNRAGVPLVEIVTRPVFGAGQRAPEVAAAYVKTLRDIFRALDVSRAQMERGNVRADVNLSLRPIEFKDSLPAKRAHEVTEFVQDPHSVSNAIVETDGKPVVLGTRTETKNVNSFRSIESAVHYEIRRQAAVLDAGEKVTQETRHWHEDIAGTSAGRPKSDADDYRYFPEPDLVPLEVDPAWVADLAKSLPEMPAARRNRLQKEWNFEDLEMRDVINASAIDVIEATVAAGAKPQGARKWWMTALATYASENGLSLDEIAASKATPKQVAELESLISTKEINDKIARQVLQFVLDGEGAPADIVQKHNLKVVSDDGALVEAIQDAFAKLPKAKEDIAGGNMGAAGPIIGMVMKATGGQADGARVRELISEEASK